MYPPAWGPNTWATLHLMAHSFPDKPSLTRKNSMQIFLKNLCVNLPCPGCSFHCSSYVSKHPPDVSSRESIKRWMFDFHNTVNKRLGKRELSYKEADEAVVSKFLNYKELQNIKTAQQIRQEDHRKIDELEKKIKENLDMEMNGSKNSSFNLAIVAITSFLLIVTVIALIIWLKPPT